MATYRVFTVSSGTVTDGAEVSKVHLKGAGIDIDAVVIGEEGRGRERGVVPVGDERNLILTPCPERGSKHGGPHEFPSAPKCERCEMIFVTETIPGREYFGSWVKPYETWAHPNQGVVQPRRIIAAELGKTKVGKPKFFARGAADTDEKIVVVFRTKIGFRGGNDHTGDRAGWKCGKYGCDAHGDELVSPETCPKCGATGSYDGPQILFANFLGEIIAKGYIAQGDAGRAGGGAQMIALVPKDVVFRTSYSGRLYGGPSAHYYKWDGEKLLAATWEERTSADLF